jgi:hypothetical protein
MSRRIKAETTDERWFEIDEEELKHYYGDDIPEDLEERIKHSLYDGDGFPGWCVELHNERDHYAEIHVYGVCEKHGRVMDTTAYNDRNTPACGSCWSEGYNADQARRNAVT